MTRYSGAVAIAKAAHGKFKYVKHVVIASGEDAAGSDPLIAAGLCGAYDAPMLLVKRTGMAPEVLAALKQMPKGVQVHVVGTPYNVNDSVLRTIRSLKNVKSVERIPSGPDRYSTAANVARRIDELRHARGWPDAPAVFIVNGADPAKYFDALAVGPIAAREMLPILLVQPDSVPPVTAAALAETRYTDIIVAGGPGTVGPAVESSVRATRRWWGPDRYSTAAAIAEGAIDMHWITPTNVGLVAKVSDAVTGSTLLGRTGGILLVTKGTSLTPVTGDYIWSIRKQIGQGYVFGGPASVTAPTMTAFTNKINR
jgi:putative cell wall-binding protein